ncbi:hypothetical protein Pan153_37910 [Gimesia panareensis]|uniref:Uncharacterized protein n=1 Tax=Gimesia panareensis TaxID=2527978 RepID=A0A518FS08_9PLAN|nr:hypothetical protein [Gimesia panareensis]QDV19128.1 hypothetical protein Pan153_37910 [Gimesia panareensis]
MDSRIKLLFSGLAIVVTFMAFVPYIRGILAGRIKPHLFSWLIWGTTTLIVFFAQLEAKGGAGAWPIGVSGTITIYIAFLSYVKRADISITRVDKLFFGASLLSLPCWYFTSNPLWAVVLLTTIDLLGFGPTIRKAYDHPYEESLLFIFLFFVRNTFALLALESYSLTTVLFPLSISCICLFLVVMISYRRRVVVADR